MENPWKWKNRAKQFPGGPTIGEKRNLMLELKKSPSKMEQVQETSRELENAIQFKAIDEIMTKKPFRKALVRPYSIRTAQVTIANNQGKQGV